MKIERIHVLRATMPRTDPQWRTASYAASAVEGLILQVYADGHRGIGAAIARPRGTPADELERELTGPVRELLVGQDASAHTLILRSLQAAEVHRSLVSAVDIALYDLLGKAANLPCHALWGGAVRSTIPIVRMVGIKPPAELVTAVGEMMGQGFTHFKVKLGTGIAEDAARIRALREVYGDGVWLGIDGNGAYSVDDAIALSRALEPLDVRLIEQPINYADLEGLARLTAASPVPVMADQYVNGMQAALEVCRRRAAHVISVKVGQTGSIDQCRHVAAMCLTSGVRVHIGGTAHPCVIDAALAHLAVSVPGIDEECEVGEFLALRDDPTGGARIEDGRYVVGSAPGLGVTLSPAV